MSITDQTFFTNKDGNSLYDRFKHIINNAKFFDVLVGYFRTSGFYRLYDAFDNVQKIRILVGINTDLKTFEIIEQAKQIDFIEEAKSIHETKRVFAKNIEDEFESSEDNYDVEKGIQKFIELIKEKRIEIKAYPKAKIHSKVYISRFDSDLLYGNVITGSSNFSESGLNGNYEFNVELKNRADVDFALQKFEDLWKDSVDLTDEYIDTINTKTWLNDEITPYQMYLKFLYEYFKDEFDLEKKEIYRPDGFFKFEYQDEAVHKLAKIVDRYNGAFISDVVGLGKTYIAAMYAQNLPGKKLVICPPPLIDNWKEAFNDFGVKSFDVESIGKLDKIVKSILKTGINKYDYVFVDEAHRFRSEETYQYNFLHQICLNKKVLLITATPLNNSFYDFFSLIKLFQPAKNSDIPEISNLEEFFNRRKKRIKAVEKEFTKNSIEYSKEVKEVAREVRNKILKHIMIRRTRKDIKEHFPADLEKQGLFFPEVETPNKIVYEFDDNMEKIFDETIDFIRTMSYARYTPLSFLKKSIKIENFEKEKEQNLKGFMKSRLIKRLESSKYAFEKTLDRFINSYSRFIDMFEKGTIWISKKIDVYDYIDNDNEDDLEKLLEDSSNKNNKDLKKYNKEYFEDNFIENLNKDLKILQDIFLKWKSIKNDYKLEKFLKSLQQDKILKNNKLVIFTESKETGEYLFENINKNYPNKVLFYSSNIAKLGDKTEKLQVAKDTIKDNFDPNSKVQANDIEILITTDVLAEGVNLHRSNIVINYDLPWNPTKILQRVGRVNRVGTKHNKIYIYNFFPTAKSESELNLEKNIKAKLQAFHSALGEDSKYLTDEESPTSFNLRGADQYDRLNSKDTFTDEQEEDIELKYRNIIRNIHDENPELFEKIKNLPKKIRVVRSFENIEKTTLITFFRKNFLEKFLKTDKTTDIPTEISFDEAVKYFECEEKTKKLNIDETYYEYLKINKEFFYNPITEQEYIAIKLSKNESDIKKRINIVLKQNNITDEEKEYLQKIKKRMEQGLLTKSIYKKLKKELEIETDIKQHINIIKNNIPITYLEDNFISEIKDKKQKKEIILSEFLKVGKK